MRIFAMTDIGKARDVNQDYYCIPEPDDQIEVFVLADGMGGYNGGEIASKLAVNSLKSYIMNNFNSITHVPHEISNLVKSAMEYANMIVFEKSKELPELEGMGTTLEVCLIYNNKAYIGHVGDSRIYKMNRHNFKLLTHDHSYVEKLVDDGTITKEEADTHPKKNMLLKAIGCGAYIEPDMVLEDISYKDIIVMCSDGLTNMVSDELLYQEIMDDIENANKNLIQKANDLGGYDNISVIIIEN